MIREVLADELQDLMPMAGDFHRLVGLPGKFDGQSFARTWEALIEGGFGLILGRFSEYEPVEAVGVIISLDAFSGEKSACLAFWMFSEPPKGLEAGMLHREMEEACRKRGALHMFVPTLESSPRIETIRTFLTRSGYTLAEHTYRKALPCQ